MQTSNEIPQKVVEWAFERCLEQILLEEVNQDSQTDAHPQRVNSTQNFSHLKKKKIWFTKSQIIF